MHYGGVDLRLMRMRVVCFCKCYYLTFSCQIVLAFEFLLEYLGVRDYVLLFTWAF